MARTIDEILGKYFQTKKLEKEIENPNVHFSSDLVEDCIEKYKKAMGKNIAYRFSSFFADDEDILYLKAACLYWEVHWYHWIFRMLDSDSSQAYVWTLCLTNKKIIVFSQGYLGTKIFNSAVRCYPLKNIQSVESTIVHIVTLRISRTNVRFEEYVEYFYNEYRNLPFNSGMDTFVAKLNEILESQTHKTVSAPPPQPSFASNTSNTNDTLEQLERLSQLYKQGVLTEQEFQEQKLRILQKTVSAPPPRPTFASNTSNTSNSNDTLEQMERPSQLHKQTGFTVQMDSFGDKKADVIKVIRALTGLGLRETNDLVESAPCKVKEGISKEDAEKIVAALKAVGADCTIK